MARFSGIISIKWHKDLSDCMAAHSGILPKILSLLPKIWDACYFYFLVYIFKSLTHVLRVHVTIIKKRVHVKNP